MRIKIHEGRATLPLSKKKENSYKNTEKNNTRYKIRTLVPGKGGKGCPSRDFDPEGGGPPCFAKLGHRSERPFTPNVTVLNKSG